MKYEQPFDVYALDASYNLVGIVAYNKLQWNRKCYDAGIFSIELNKNQYNDTWKYIYSPDRRELGIISQVNMSFDKGIVAVTVSGKFAESELDNMVVYPKPDDFYTSGSEHTSITSDNPSWLTPPGDLNADEEAMAFFDGFKSITYVGYDIEDASGQTLKERTYALDIVAGSIDTSHGTYKPSVHYRNGEYLGNKLSSILKPSNAFFTVDYDYLTNVKSMNIRHGRDLTSDNEDGNNPVVFSSENGTIAKGGVVKSKTDTKDVIIGWQENEVQTIVMVDGHDEAVGRFYSMNSLPNLRSYPIDHDYRVAVNASFANELEKHVDKINLSFSIFDGSYEYITDFDIGDVVSVSIPEIDLSANVQIVGCYETIQNGMWSLDIEFGIPLKGGRR